MARSLSAIKVSNQFAATLANEIDGGNADAQASHGATFTPGTTLTSGTTADKADRVWQDKGRTLADTITENIDLYDFGGEDIGGGAGNDATGQAMALAEIVRFFVVVDPTSVGSLIIGAEGSAAAWSSVNGSDTVQITTIGPGGYLDLFRRDDPAFAVADTTNHLCKFEATGGAVTYDIYILGRSA